jgi:hypothetical protein
MAQLGLKTPTSDPDAIARLLEKLSTWLIGHASMTFQKFQ